jgi:hypothetical protein
MSIGGFCLRLLLALSHLRPPGQVEREPTVRVRHCLCFFFKAQQANEQNVGFLTRQSSTGSWTRVSRRTTLLLVICKCKSESACSTRFETHVNVRFLALSLIASRSQRLEVLKDLFGEVVCGVCSFADSLVGSRYAAGTVHIRHEWHTQV